MSSNWYTSLIRRNNHIIPTVFFNIWSSTGQKRRNLGRKIVTLGLILQISLKSLQKNATYLIKQVVEWVYKYDWTKVWLFYIIFDSSSEENRRKSKKKITDGDGKLLDDFRSGAKKMRFLALYFAYGAS